MLCAEYTIAYGRPATGHQWDTFQTETLSGDTDAWPPKPIIAVRSCGPAVARNQVLRYIGDASQQNREICREDNCRHHVACNIQRRAIVRCHACVRHQDERQVLLVVRRRPRLSRQGGHPQARHSSHLQRLCRLVHARFRQKRGWNPALPGSQGAMPANRRACRPLQPHAIRRNGKAITIMKKAARLAAFFMNKRA
jgi:hypothetical protein